MKNDFFRKKDVESGIEYIQKGIINDIITYLKTGINPNVTPNKQMYAYTTVQFIADGGDEDCAKLVAFHNKTIENYLLDCKNDLENEGDENFIENFIIYTEKINYLIFFMVRIFIYLDRFYTKAIIKISLAQGAMNLYKSIFYDYFKNNIFIEIEKLIYEDRNGNKESRSKIKRIMNIIKDFEIKNVEIKKEGNQIIWREKNSYWNDDFESRKNRETPEQDLWFREYFSKDTKKYAETKANKDLLNMSISEYILSQIEYIEEEYERQKELINPKYHDEINQINYKYLLIEPLKDIGPMESSIKNLIDTERSREHPNLYKLIKMIPKDKDPIAPVFDSYIKDKYEELLKNEELVKDQYKFISQLINLKLEMDTLVKEHFKNMDYFKSVKEETFSSFMDKENFGVKLSDYIDYNMRIGFKGKSPEEIDKILDGCISLFHCLKERILFQNNSNKKMSERLIKDSSLSISNEEKFISKLKQEAGLSYVTNMNKMMADYMQSKENIELYKSLSHKGAPNGINMKVKVLSQSAWELNKKSFENFKLPKLLSFCLDDFQNFYLNKYKEKKLFWCLRFSKVEIQYLYLEKQYISFSLLSQLLCLLLLEQKGELSLENISQLLECDINTIINDIQGLVYNPSFNPTGLGDKGIIIGSFNKEKKEFKKDDKIMINKDFYCSKIRFNTFPLKRKKTDSENIFEREQERNMKQRYENYIIQAAITRIMKSRYGMKTNPNWLLNETGSQIDLFIPKPEQIRENIEKLIERNVIKVISDENEVYYDYVA